MSKKSFINISGEDYILFYNKNSKEIWYLDSEGRDIYGKKHFFKHLVELPYKESIRANVWREFHRRLDDESKKLFSDYENRRLRWRDIEDAGLTPFFQDIESELIDQMLDDWANDNRISIDWENTSIN